MWVVVTLASLAVFVVFVLCVPLDVALQVDVYGRPKSSMKVIWLFGLVNKEIKRDKKENPKRKPEEKKRKKDNKAIFEILRIKGFLRQLIVLARGSFRRLEIKELEINFKIGLDNPADTALLFAFVGPTTALLNPPSNYRRIEINPSFADDAVLEGNIHGVMRLLPVKLIAPFTKFVFSLPVMRAIKILVSARWKRKK